MTYNMIYIFNFSLFRLLLYSVLKSTIEHKHIFTFPDYERWSFNEKGLYGNI